jgi:hypothetical protein
MQQKYQEDPKLKNIRCGASTFLASSDPTKNNPSLPPSTSTSTIQDSNPHHIEPLTSALHHRRATNPSFTMTLHPEKKGTSSTLPFLDSYVGPTSQAPALHPSLHTETYIRPVRPSFRERCAIKRPSLD